MVIGHWSLVIGHWSMLGFIFIFSRVLLVLLVLLVPDPQYYRLTRAIASVIILLRTENRALIFIYI
ncbi:MAG: hypothetical protein C6Y22_00065 [Hapalosiphonaceae cyanobacterium JJU2]|nr:MAG: hypothetical protein C6Y22_00065 [Hapalosiphonaceae cyanobacterium JJU2]